MTNPISPPLRSHARWNRHDVGPHGISHRIRGHAARTNCDDRAAAVSLIRRAVELGIDHIDTAQSYGNGFSNSILREALRPEDDVTVVTKVGADPAADGPLPIRYSDRSLQW
jgi:aryl-alcohol dehydrogenase-like predicted oxidoreductase